MADLIGSSLFYQLAAILILAGVCGAVAYILRQPLIVAFIAAGLLAGPDMLRVVAADDHTMETLAHLGIALLLFMVGLKLDLGLIAKLGRTAVLTGLLQIAITLVLGGAICLMFGFGFVESLLIGTALALSSTIIVVKLLSDRRAIDSLYGQISLGILIIQDIFVILVTVVIGAMASAGGGFDAQGLGLIILKVAALAAAAALFIRFAAQPLSRVLASSPELMVIFAIGFAGMAAALCEYIGLSREMGGLVAGITLATTPLNNVLAARLMGLRDFLLLFFFVGLGAHMDLQGMAQQLLPALVLSAFVLGAKPLIVMVIMRATGYRRRTGFMAGITLSQISEFSMILMAMAAGAGIVGAESVSMITLVALITIGLSTYAIIYSERLCDFLDGRTAFFGKAAAAGAVDEEIADKGKSYDVIVFGMGRYGAAMAREFQKRGLSVLGVDFNPEAIRHAQAMGIPALYGDAADPEFPAHLPLAQAKAVVFAFHHYVTGPLTTDLRRTLAYSLRGHGYRGHIAATSHMAHHDHDLTRQGIDIVLMPFDDAARHAAEKIASSIGTDKAIPST